MANDFYTLIVVPHAKARFRKFQVSVKLTKWALGVSATLALAVGGVLVHYSLIAVEVADLQRLRVENRALTAKTRVYEENAGKLKAQVDSLQRMVTKLGVMAGLESSLPEPGAAGVGGVGGVPSLESTAPSADIAASFDTMGTSVESLAEKSEKLTEFYETQKVLLASTPSVWPVRGYLSSQFGNRLDPFTSQFDFHPGIDVSTPAGTKIQAPADGVVVSCGVKGAYGNAMVIDHGYGIVTRYAHLSAFAAKPGQRVRRGDVIAYVGQTGRSTAPHLHYEVWVKDKLQNPIHYILDEYRTFG
jgi:murein DD-endopeptidase MepM/ murein hydrolase activator NlpD